MGAFPLSLPYNSDHRKVLAGHQRACTIRLLVGFPVRYLKPPCELRTSSRFSQMIHVYPGKLKSRSDLGAVTHSTVTQSAWQAAATATPHPPRPPPRPPAAPAATMTFRSAHAMRPGVCHAAPTHQPTCPRCRSPTPLRTPHPTPHSTKTPSCSPTVAQGLPAAPGIGGGVRLPSLTQTVDASE